MKVFFIPIPPTSGVLIALMSFSFKSCYQFTSIAEVDSFEGTEPLEASLLI